MAQTRIAVFEDTNMTIFDVLCPNCFETLKENYKGQRGRFSCKCPSCNKRWYEYSAIAVEPGEGESISQASIEKTLKSFWDSQYTMGRGRKSEYETEARKLNLTWDPV